MSGAGLLSLFHFKAAGTSTALGLVDFNFPLQGRALHDSASIFDKPSTHSTISSSILRDSILNITAATLGEDDTAYNRTWYKTEKGYIHSSDVQPMQVNVNPAIRNFSPKGMPAEVTVPFTDSVWSIRPGGAPAYRLYYGAVVWVDRVQENEQGQIWYRIFDEGEGPIYYYAKAEDLHLCSSEEIAPLSPEIPPVQKRIDVRLAEQVVIAYEGKIPVMMTRAATGATLGGKDLRTPIGRYFTNYKFPSRHMVHPDRYEENAYDLPGVPWVIFLTTNGVALHGTYWHNDYGKPRSHGCINLNLTAAKWLFRWSLPGVPLNERSILTKEGTIVDII